MLSIDPKTPGQENNHSSSFNGRRSRTDTANVVSEGSFPLSYTDKSALTVNVIERQRLLTFKF